MFGSNVTIKYINIPSDSTHINDARYEHLQAKYRSIHKKQFRTIRKIFNIDWFDGD